jgi:hypothetical protein
MFFKKHFGKYNDRTDKPEDNGCSATTFHNVVPRSSLPDRIHKACMRGIVSLEDGILVGKRVAPN